LARPATGPDSKPILPGTYCVIDDLDAERDVLVVAWLNILHKLRRPVFLFSDKSLKSGIKGVPSDAYRHASALGLNVTMLDHIRPLSRIDRLMRRTDFTLEEALCGPQTVLRAATIHDPADPKFRSKVDDYIHGGAQKLDRRPTLF
jgi:hypothetical protein